METGTENITQDQAKTLIKNYHGGRFFGVTFIKRTNGKERTMNCRKGVAKGTVGGKLKFNPNDKDLISVWDRHKDDYRFVASNALVSLSLGGRKYLVNR